MDAIIGRLEKFVDGLESITKSLGLLQEQHARLRDEIESISDLESLRLLRDASNHGSSLHDVLDTASRRLVSVAESIRERRTVDSNSVSHGPESYVTAKSNLSITTGSILSDTPPVPDAWPNSNLALNARRQYEHPSLSSQLQYVDPALATHRIPEWGQFEGKVYLPPPQECLENQLESELKNKCVCKECAAKGIPLIFCLTNGKGDHCMGPSWVKILRLFLGQLKDTKKDASHPNNRVADQIQPSDSASMHNTAKPTCLE